MKKFGKNKIREDLDRAVSEITPDIYESVSSERVGKASSPLPGAPRRRTTGRMIAVVLAVCICVSALAATLILSRDSDITGPSGESSSPAVSGTESTSPIYEGNTIITIDVNPGIELTADPTDKVIAVRALNPEGQTVIGDMELVGTDLELAVNAITGSMVRNGYLVGTDGRILVSVICEDDARSQQLVSSLSGGINSAMQNSGVNAVILDSVYNSEQADISSLAESLSITYGKAALIKGISDKYPSLDVSSLASMSLWNITKLVSDEELDISGIVGATGSVDQYIAQDQALSAALEHASLSADSITVTEFKLDSDDGRTRYEIEFLTDTDEYEYEVDAFTGSVIHAEKDAIKLPSTGSDQTGTYLTTAQAKDIALKAAGVSASDVIFVRAQLGEDDGRMEYDIEFYINGTEYDFEIDAVTGAILSYDMEIEGFHIPTTNPSQNEYINSESAYAKALERAGLASDKVVKHFVKLDNDDGRALYEVEFVCDGTEYEIEVDALTGEIVKYETETVGNGGTGGNQQTLISIDDAKAKAAERAGLNASQVIFTKVELDSDDGRTVYEIEFVYGNTEYDVEVNASTGAIVKYEEDREELPSAGQETIISIDEARAKAAERAGLTVSQVTFTKVELDVDDGRKVYDTEFVCNGVEYSVEIDASTGSVIKYESERNDDYVPGGTQDGIISADEAKAKAAERAGLSVSQVTFTKVELDFDDGRSIYEIEFRYGNTEYEAEINAATGAVIDFESEYDD